MTQPLVTVAVVSWNSRDHLGACLESLRPDVEAGRAVVVVVDNASTDGSADLVADRFPGMILIQTGENLGFGRAVNLGLGDAETPWVAAANADIEITPGALTALIRAADDYPEAGVLAPQLELPDGTAQDSVFGFPRLSATIAATLGLHTLSPSVAAWIRYGRKPPPPSHPSVVSYAMGAFLLFRRAAFEVAGGFDPTQWMYSEDLDICWRLDRTGFRTIYVPGVTVKHHGGASTRQAFGLAEGTPEITDAHYHWLRRRRGIGVMLINGIVVLAGAICRVLVYGIVGIVSRQTRRQRLPRARQWLHMNAQALSNAIFANEQAALSDGRRE